jgi:RES domain-containing protein
MQVYRVGALKFSGDLSGEGAKLFGGRWNHKTIPCIYTSQSRALAILEYTVNINIDEVPRALSITTFEIPESAIKLITAEKLPGNWKESPAPSSTKDFGSALIKSLSFPVYKIPSCLINDEYNFLLNPMHPQKKLFKILEIKDFVYDVRIKLK